QPQDACLTMRQLCKMGIHLILATIKAREEMIYPVWYSIIELGIRQLVYDLRNNGINTTCLCEHKKYIEADSSNDDDIQKIINILFVHGYDKVGFTLTRTIVFNPTLCK